MSYDMIDRFLRNNLGDDDYAEYSAALDELVAPPKQDVPETNFGNMAEPKIGCVNRDCDQCKAVQEPAPKTWELTTPATALSGGGGSGSAPVQEPVAIVVAAEYEDGSTAGHRLEWRGRNEANDFPEGTEFYTAQQPVPVKTYHDGKPWPVAPKPWVGLTDEEIDAAWPSPKGTNSVRILVHIIEAKLKEKNT